MTVPSLEDLKKIIKEALDYVENKLPINILKKRKEHIKNLKKILEGK